MSAWYAKTEQAVLEELEVNRRTGLSAREADKRLERYGPNQLAGGRRKSLLRRFLDQMRDPMILVLLAAAVLSLLASGGEDWIESVIILVIVAVNACLSIAQENNAEKALEALRGMSAPLARVLRDGAQLRLETARLVPGDIILLEAGDLIPADARILECSGLKADESAMTGESAPVSKSAVGALPPDTALGDRVNMLLASTVVTNGRATAVVTATGGQVIATGGGAILRPENVTALRRSGRLVFLDRSPEKLIATADRPLASDREALRRRYEERYDLYCAAADLHIDGDGTVEETAQRIEKEWMK